MQISLLQNGYKQTGNYKTVFARVALNDIKVGKYKKSIETLQALNDEEAQKEYKKTMAGVTWSGTFTTRQKRALSSASGLACLDFDGIDNAKELKEELKKDPYVYAAWISPRGKGVKALVKIPIVQNDEEFKSYYLPLLDYFDGYCKADQATKDISRSTIQSYDPYLYENEESKIWTKQKEIEQFIYEVPNIVIKDHKKIIDHLLKWHYDNYTGKERNNHIFKLAYQFNCFGIDRETCESQLLQFEQKDFGAFEIINCIKSAYSYKEVFGKTKLEDKKNVDLIKDKIKCGATLPKLLELYPDWEKEINKQWDLIDVSEFWSKSTTKSGAIKLEIEPILLKTFLQRNNFAKYRLTNNLTTFIRIDGHFIEEVTEEQIKEFVLNNLESRAESSVFNMFAKQTSVFKKDYLNLLKVLEFKTFKDTESEAFLKYQNCIVKVTKNGYKTLKYNDLNLFVWRDEVIKRDFIEQDTSGEYKEFINLLANKEPNKINCFKSTIGYLMHGFNNPANMKAVIINDSSISDESQGGTGKSLFNEGIEKIVNTVILNGKDFDEDNKHKFEEVERNTKLICLDDVRKNFKFESLFSSITRGLKVDVKGVKSFTIPFENTPKFCLTTNYSIKGTGHSDMRRKHEIEVSDYFRNTPPLVHFGHFLFNNWSLDEWAKFDNYMINCLSYYLKTGLLEDKTTNLELKKLLQKIGMDLFEWFENNNYISSDKPNGTTAQEYYNLMIDSFKNARSIINDLTQPKFTRYFRAFCEFKGWYFKPPTGNNKNYIIRKTEVKQESESETF